MSRKVLYEDDNRKDEKNGSQYDRLEWEGDDKSNNRDRPSHDWVDTKTGEQGYHGEDCSKEDKRWAGKRWNS